MGIHSIQGNQQSTCSQIESATSLLCEQKKDIDRESERDQETEKWFK